MTPRRANVARVGLVFVGAGLCLMLPMPWWYLGLVVFVSSVLGLMKVGRKPISEFVEPPIGEGYDVRITTIGSRYIEMMKVVREYSCLDANRVRQIFDATPTEMGLWLTREDADSLALAVNRAGGEASVLRVQR